MSFLDREDQTILYEAAGHGVDYLEINVDPPPVPSF
jgi:hypothetical protein